MEKIAQKHLDKFTKIKHNIEDFYTYFQHNIDRFNDYKNLVFNTSLSDEDISKLELLSKPILEFNVLEAFISRLRGEFAEQIPTIDVKPLNQYADALTCDVLQNHIRHIIERADGEQLQNQVYNDTLAGGYSVMKVWTAYKDDTDEQDILLGRVFDPCLCGFDPLARSPSKADGKFCYELYPMYKEDFERRFPHVDTALLRFNTINGGFEWYYRTPNHEVVLVADYYEVKTKTIKKHRLVDGKIMSADDYEQMIQSWDAASLPPAIVGTFKAKEQEIWRYRLNGNEILEKPVLTSFTYLPLIFVDGNSQMLRNNTYEPQCQMTRPYVYHAADAQRLKNFLGQTFAAEMQNMEQHKWLAEQDTIPPQYVEAWKNTQIPGTLIWKGHDDQGNELPAPMPVQRQPIPSEISNGFAGADATIQSILGSYDAQQGIMDNELSGKAIEVGASQSDSAAKPYLTNYMAALDQAAKIILDLIPKYYVTPRTIPITDANGKHTFIKINQQAQQMIPNQNPQLNAQMGSAVPGMQQGIQPQMQQQQQMPMGAQSMPFNAQQPMQPQGNQPSPMQGISLMYERNTFDVTVKAGVNSAVQKNRALQMMAQNAQAFPRFGQFINDVGLPIIIKNFDIEGQQELVELSQKWIQMQQQQASQQQPNPQMLDLQLRQQQMQIDAKKNDTDAQLDQARLALEKEKIANEKLKIQLQAHQANADDSIQLIKARTERESKIADLALNAQDQHHRHAKETLEYIDNKNQPKQQTGANQNG